MACFLICFFLRQYSLFSVGCLHVLPAYITLDSYTAPDGLLSYLFLPQTVLLVLSRLLTRVTSIHPFSSVNHALSPSAVTNTFLQPHTRLFILEIVSKFSILISLVNIFGFDDLDQRKVSRLLLMRTIFRFFFLHT